jgi:hypothetical protein
MIGLSPAAQAVWNAAWELSPINCKSHEDRRRQQIAAALRVAAEQNEYIPDMRDEMEVMFSKGWNSHRKELLGIAAELEQLDD